MQKIQLSIPEPCHENWNRMTPTEQGRFCKSCAKEVIDFAMMTDTEVLNYFSNLSNSKVCGRVMPSQLDRTISRPKEPRKRLFWYWNYVAMFFLFFSKSNPLKAQKGKIRPEVVTTPTCTKTMGIMVMPVSSDKLSHRLSGKVVDKDQVPVPYASVRIKGNNTWISADENGRFTITVFNTSVLEVSAASYRTVEIQAGNRDSITIKLETILTDLRGDVVISTFAGGISFRDPDEKLNTPIKPKHIDEFVIRDMNGNKPLANVSMLFIKTGTLLNKESGLTDAKGLFRLKRTNKEDGYNIKVSAAGYEPAEFTITGKEFNERKTAWEILLVKQYIPENSIRIGQVTTMNQAADPIYVVDGVITATGKDLDPAEIRNVEVLKPAEATALFGTQGIHGAVLITTKQSRLGKTKDLDTVVVNVIREENNMRRIAGMVNVLAEKVEFKAPVLSEIKNSSAPVIFPNPVNRGQVMYIDASFLPAGQYEIRIYQASGVLMDKRPLAVVPGMKRVALPTRSHWTPGQYSLVITDLQGKKSIPHSFIVL